MIEWTRKPRKRGSSRPYIGPPCKACGNPTSTRENKLCFGCYSTGRAADGRAADKGEIRTDMRVEKLDVLPHK